MSIEDRLDHLPGFEGLQLPSLNALSAAADRVLARWPDVIVDPPDLDRDRLVREMRDRVFNDNWEGARLSFVLAAARALYDGERAERPTLAMLRAFYVDEIRASTREAFLGGMMSVYLGSYQPGAPHTRALAGALADARARIGPRWRRLLAEIPAVFDPVAAPAAIADRMMAMPDPWLGLRLLGLRTPHAPGILDHAHLAFVARMAPLLRARQAVDRLLGWLRPDPQRPPRMAGAPAALEAILAPWHQETPSPDMVSYLSQSLVGLYGDPRIARGGAWAGVSEAGVGALLRWLTGENIRFFLDVVTAVEASHMWEPRRRFWLALHEEGRIDGAWAAFSSDAADHARRMARASGARGTIGHGWQTAGGSRANTSLLVLRIGGRIVIEGSHDYKVHLFEAGDPEVPALYQSAYNCERIRLLPGALARAHNGDWQGWVLDNL